MKDSLVRRRILSAVCFALLVLALALPVDLALQFLGTPAERALNAALSIALVALLGSLGWIANRRAALLLLLPLLVASLFIRLLYGSMVHFSGQGFGHELFVHLDPEALRIIWYEYDRLVYRAAALCLLAAFAFWLMVRPRPRAEHRLGPALAVTAAALLALLAGRAHLPEWQLWQAWQEWQRPGAMPAARPDDSDDNHPNGARPRPQALLEQAARWHGTGLLDTDLPGKDEIQAETVGKPRNLILLYIEALTSSIVDHPDHPDLMPNFRRLVRQHGWIEEFHTSSFVTIEGVANTQCGLLFPFRGHGSGFAGRQMLAQALPCLGDVLDEAGYHQVYVGGSPMSFTGKGPFLAAHGYDDLKGWEYWQSRGHERAPGHWGLGDADLLDQARLAIAQARDRNQPFNVTALTVGTHIPGYSYEECAPYQGGDHRFLDALHCTDQLVGEWIERLRADNLLEDSILVVVGDHPLFFNPVMQKLFGQAIHDTRMPLIVIGEDLKAPLHQRGAGFDLAPTLLDLLGVRHDAKFAMGRSLAAPHDRPDYLITRRHDIHEGKTVHNPPGECDRKSADTDPDQPPALPLSPCEKRELLDLLYQLARAHSHQPAPMDCSAEEPALLRVPAGRIGPVAVRVNGRDWSNRFSRRGRITHPTEPGLYALALESSGRPSAATFLPAESLAGADPEPLPEDVTTAHTVLVAWRPADDITVDLSALLPALPGQQQGAGAWVVQPGRADPLAESLAAGGRPALLSINRNACNRIRK